MALSRTLVLGRALSSCTCRCAAFPMVVISSRKALSRKAPEKPAKSPSRKAHIHLVAVPQKADVLARTLKETHGRFASCWNALHHSTGHVWQGRYYSCPLDEPQLWEALRYTELNPVRASLVASVSGCLRVYSIVPPNGEKARSAR